MVLKCFHQSDFARDWSNYLSRVPGNRAEFDAATHFILGHFTTSTFLPNILKDGLTPDEHMERAVDDNVPSDNTSVYLAATYDRFYMKRATKYHGGEAISIEVLVNKASLSADEAWVGPQDLATIDPDEALYRSMCGGACKHRGKVPIENILSICDAHGTVIYTGKVPDSMPCMTYG